MEKFKTIKKKVDTLLKELDDKASSESINLLSNEYEILREKLKRKIVEEKGYNFQQYTEQEDNYDKELNEDEFISMAEKLKRKKERATKSLEEKEQSFNNEVQERIEQSKNIIKDELDNTNKELEKKIEKRIKDVETIVVRNTDNIRKDIENIRNDKQQIINTKEILNTKEIVRELDEVKIKELREEFKKDVISMQNNLQDLWKDTLNSKFPIPSKIKSLINEGIMEVIRKDENSLLGGPLRRMGMGLQGQIDSLIANGTGGGISDAPNDGNMYVRQNGAWVKISV